MARSDQWSSSGTQPKPAGPRGGRAGEAALTGLAAAAFVAVSAWWCARDTSVQDWDNALHTLYAFVARDQLAAGALTAPWRDWNPPSSWAAHSSPGWA